jgi:hypothetical protein
MNTVPQSLAATNAELFQNEIYRRTSPPQHLVDLVRGTEFDSPTLVVGRIEEVVRSIDRINAALPVGQSEIVDDFRAIGVSLRLIEHNFSEFVHQIELLQAIFFGGLILFGIVGYTFFRVLRRKLRVLRQAVQKYGRIS